MNRMEKPQPEHIVQSSDEELKRLSSTILRMGGIAERQLASAIQAVARRDSELAERVVQMDGQIDQLADEVDALCTRLVALRQPMAVSATVAAAMPAVMKTTRRRNARLGL